MAIVDCDVSLLCLHIDVMAWTMQKQNVNGMKLVEGKGNMPGRLKEGDKINTIYVLVCALF